MYSWKTVGYCHELWEENLDKQHHEAIIITITVNEVCVCVCVCLNCLHRTIKLLAFAKKAAAEFVTISLDYRNKKLIDKIYSLVLTSKVGNLMR